MDVGPKLDKIFFFAFFSVFLAFFPQNVDLKTSMIKKQPGVLADTITIFCRFRQFLPFFVHFAPIFRQFFLTKRSKGDTGGYGVYLVR